MHPPAPPSGETIEPSATHATAPAGRLDPCFSQAYNALIRACTRAATIRNHRFGSFWGEDAMIRQVVVLIACTFASAAWAATFPGSGVGAIADGGAGCAPTYGTPLNVTFAVTGITGNPTSVSVDVTMTHTFVGDLDVQLIAPNGAFLILFSRVGATTASGFGDNSELGGTYGFSDDAVADNFWTVATAGSCGDMCIVGPDTYRTTEAGGAGAVNPQPVTSLNAAFAALTNANGTWTLRLRDGCQADTGLVTAANLTIVGIDDTIFADGFDLPG